MKWYAKYLFLWLICCGFYSYGQISPGDLTTAHAKFEGMSNCTLCHDLGNKVANNKCLDCHKGMQALVKAERGYHVSADVKGKACTTCHSEHYGRKFKMIRIDIKKFNHDLTGYKLEGKHDEIDCKKCHNSDNIADNDIKKRPNTFIGLETKCVTCHTDYHQETLSSSDCASCHNTEKFKPAANFNHNDADFKLVGKHLDVACVKCHKEEKRNGKDFQNFNHIKFTDCNTCHSNPHEETITGSCKQCHTETSFKNFRGKGRFNHNTTNFTLNGAHKKVACFSCHKKNDDPKLVFQDKLNIDEASCVKCHEDKHEGKLGNDCAKCHNETAFVSLKTLEFFDHNLTDFPLEGLHKKVDCKKCHDSGKYTEKIEFKSCNNCHDDYHQGEFTTDNNTPDCKTCHSVKQGFDTSLFTLEEHQKTEFPLNGAHAATPCFACHLDEKDNDRWTFKNKETACVTCHNDIHKNYISSQFYPDKKCETCHSNDAWSDVNFDHSKTDWPLEGKHLETDCRNCHFSKADSDNKTIQKFANLDTNCSTCHQDNHNNQFAINGVTDCTKCHVSKNWIPEKFDHSTTNFRLDGRHAEVACNKCHKALNNTEKRSFNYKIEKFACIDCHR